MIKIRRGLDLPIEGQPVQTITEGPHIRTVALVGFDYHGLKPTMAVQVGDKVKTGQLLFTDKKTEGVRYTAPASGTIAAINRGYQRALQSVVIDVEGDEAEVFASYNEAELATLSSEKVEENLLQSGLWTALRTRPYSKVPAANTRPNSLFVNVMDTNPLAVDPTIVVADREADFKAGLSVLGRLIEGKVYVCQQEGKSLPAVTAANIETKTFGGVHPAGNSSTHIHFVDAASASKKIWTINYQEVIAIGALFLTGKLDSRRVISLAGPQVEEPAVVRTVLGASLEELTAGKLKTGENRVISGSVFGGRNTWKGIDFLGRYHLQVSVLLEGRERPFFHYLVPGVNRFSVMPIYLSKLFKNKLFSFTTSTNGSERAMVPIGSYEKVMPLDILPTQLLRALVVGDTEMAQKLGCLELDEEDLALCTFVCSGKYEYGPILRQNLERIEKEG